ncbi:MAG: cation diffusion facilitator family transporter [Ruminococcus sp.]|nr:cation diffusion facilitator family transporter [Ruminococcus sp.]
MTNKNQTLNERQELDIAMRTSVVSIIANLILSVFKFIAGIFGRSAAMVSDAVHSASDVFSTVIVIIGVKIAHKASDEDHPYGHDRLECVAAVVLAVVLAVTGIGIGWSGIGKIASGSIADIAIPTALPMIAAVISIAVKEGMYWYTRAAAKKIGSDALMADAWHHRSDSLSSIGSLIGIIGARMGYAILDPVASVVICLFILKAAFDIFMEALEKMVDKSCDKETVEKMKREVLSVEGVIALDELKTRLFGAKCYVDIEIGADGNSTLFTAHAIAEKVHDGIEKNFPEVKHCMVHVNPVDVKAIEGRIEKAGK